MLPAARIAEGKGNHGRARSLRLRLAEVLAGLGRESEALEALLAHLNNPDASTSVETDSAPAERLALMLHVAVLEEAAESAAVVRKVEKRVLKESGINKASGGAGAAAEVDGSRSGLTFEYRAKALAKDDAEGGPVAKRLEDAMQALEVAAGSVDAAASQGEGSQASSTRCQQLAARFVHVFVGRAVRRAECGGTGEGWQQVLIACARCRSALGKHLAADEGWTSAATLLSSTYHPISPAQDLYQMATENSKNQSNPWLAAESCLYLAWVAWSTGDGSTAGTLLNAAQVARLLQAQSRGPASPAAAAAAAGSPDGLSGPGSNWRELALECLVSEQLGYPGTDRDPTVAEAKLDAAVSAVDASLRLRGPPLGGRDLSGSLALARASLLITLGRLEEAHSAVSVASDGISHTCGTGGGASGGRERASMTAQGDDSEQQAEAEAEAEAAGVKKNNGGCLSIPCLRCRALCVASDVDLAEGLEDDAELKLREALGADGGFAGALIRLGWLLLGFARVGADGEEGKRRVTVAAEGRERESAVLEAMQLLERAVKEQPGSSIHAFRLAR